MNHAAKTNSIKLEGAGCLMYNDIAEFMGEKRNIVTVNREITSIFFNDLAADVLAQNEGGAGLEATLDVSVKLGDSTYSAIQCAISVLYQQSNI